MKSVEEIYGEMLDCFAQRTGMRPAEGCDLAARLYAVAAQVYSLYVQADWAGRQVLPQTAEGEFLDRHAQLRGITRKEAAPATGVIRFTAGETADAARTIPVGTVCMTAGRVRFETTEEGTIQPGELTADVPAQAAEAGSAGNVAAGSVVVMAVAPAGVAACTNPEPCTGGADRETDEGLRERVMDSFRRLPNGANAAFYQREALSFPQIAAASVIPRPRGIGTVDVIAATRAGVPDEELLAQLADHLQSRREIAVEVQVKAPTLSTVTMYLQLKPKEGYTFAQVAAGVKQKLQDWFTGERLGQDILRSELGDLIYHCEGVANYNIVAPKKDVAGSPEVLPQLGRVTTEAMK